MVKRIISAGFLLAIVIVAGIFGYMWIEGYKMLKDQEKVYRVEDIFVDADSIFAGKTLKTSDIMERKGFSVVAVRKGGRYIFNPSGDERIETGDALILIGESKSIREVKAVKGQ